MSHSVRENESFLAREAGGNKMQVEREIQSLESKVWRRNEAQLDKEHF